MKSCRDQSFLPVEARRHNLPPNAAHISEKLFCLIAEPQFGRIPLVLQSEV